MYSQDPAVRRRKVKLRYFSYGVMALLIAVFATLSIMYVQGFRVNQQLEVRQGGLVKFDSRPQDADIAIDGKRIEQTPYQVTVPAGQHTVSYTRDQYRPWQKNIDVRAGQVLWLNYPRLIPTDVTTEPISSHAALHQVSAAQNREWLLLLSAPESRTFTLVNVTDERNIRETQVSLPAESFGLAAAPGETFTVLSWSGDARQVLLKHAVGDAVEFVVVPLEDPAKAVNLTKLSALPLAEVEFAPGSDNQFFARTPENKLYRLNSQDKADIVLIDDAMLSYDALSSDVVAYVAQIQPATPDAKPERLLRVWQRGKESRVQLRSLPADAAVSLSYASYLTRTYLTVLVDNELQVIENPLVSQKKTVFTKQFETTPTQLSDSPNNRFVVARFAQQLRVYDIELAKLYDVTLPEGAASLQWVDDHHLSLNDSGTLRLMEFDGTNNEPITSVAGAYGALLGADGEALLSINKNASSGAFELQRSALVRQQDVPFLRI